jgi:undecaprenyl-diphosphatase
MPAPDEPDAPPPESPPALATEVRIAGWLIAAGVAGVVFTVMAVLVVEQDTSGFDRRATLAFQSIGSPGLDAAIRAITDLGSWQVCMAVSVAVAVWCGVRRQWRAMTVMLAAYLTAEAVNQILKQIFARPRPELLEKIPLPDSYSFPSGHAMSAVVVYGVIAIIAARLVPRTGRVVTVVMIAVIAATGASRVYLGVHWTVDVLAGFCGGIPLLAAAAHVIPAAQRAVHGT